MQFSSLRHAACAVLLLLAVGLHPTSHGSANRRLLITYGPPTTTITSRRRWVEKRDPKTGVITETEIFKCTTCKDTGLVNGWSFGLLGTNPCTALVGSPENQVKCDGKGWLTSGLDRQIQDPEDYSESAPSYSDEPNDVFPVKLEAERYTGRNWWTAGFLSSWVKENYKLDADGTLGVDEDSYKVPIQTVDIIDTKELEFKVSIPKEDARYRKEGTYLRFKNAGEAQQWKKALSWISNVKPFAPWHGDGQLKDESSKFIRFLCFQKAWRDRSFVGWLDRFGYSNGSSDKYQGYYTKIKSVEEEKIGKLKNNYAEYEQYGYTRFRIRYYDEVPQRPSSLVRFKTADVPKWREYFKQFTMSEKEVKKRRRLAATPFTRFVSEIERATGDRAT